jgi:hypothetical protein
MVTRIAYTWLISVMIFTLALGLLLIGVFAALGEL